MKYYIMFGVSGSLSDEIGISGTYISKDRAYKAGYACLAQIPAVNAFMVFPVIDDTREEIVKKIMPLYQDAYPNDEHRLGGVFDRLHEAPMDYLVSLLDTLMISETA